jgi:hypothetical protein
MCMSLYKIAEFYTEWFSLCPKITSKFRIIAILETSSKETVIQIKDVCTSIIFSVPVSVCLSVTVRELSP